MNLHLSIKFCVTNNERLLKLTHKQVRIDGVVVITITLPKKLECL